MRIDCHTHFIPVAMLEEIKRSGARFGMEVRDDPSEGLQLIMKGVPHPSLAPFSKVEEHFERMRKTRIDTHVVWQSSRPNIFWADAELGLALSHIINDEYAAMAQRYPGRFIGIGSVPLQDVPKAVTELQRAVKNGLRGVMTNTNINGRYLDDVYFWPFYEALEDADVPLFLHPANPFGADKLKEFHLNYLMGLPSDTTLCVARLIFSGTLDRFPRLRLMVPHGGGMLPFIQGRLDHGYNVRAECQKIERKPSEYLVRMLFDSVVFDPAVLGPAATRYRFALGSDFPYDMEDPTPVETVEAAPNLDADLREAVFAKNLLAFLGA
jgi:aminocarboxymuconate-semialdehyde decarboxylase